MIDRRSRLLGSLYGLLVGDALGVPYESCPLAVLRPLHGIEAIPARWMSALRGKAIVEPLAQRLLANEGAH